MEAKKALERDWSSLPLELLNLIAKNLKEISDFVRFRAVCTAWRFSTPITDVPPQFPWILEDRMYPYEPHMRFYSTTSNKMYTIHAPKYLGKMFMGSSQGYMLTLLCDCTPIQDFSAHHICQFALLNPLNNHEIPLPSFRFGLCSPFYLTGPQQYQIGEYVVLCDYFSCQGYKLIYCYLGQDNWCEFKKLDYGVDFRYFHLKSMLFLVDEGTGVIKVADLTTGTLAYVIPPVEDDMMDSDYYLVDALGDILIVIQRYDDSCDSYDHEFDVHRLEVSGGSSPCWVKVKNIGNQALFIDKDGGFALEASDFAGIKANCIYYIESYSWVKRIDIETGNWKLQCPFDKPERWFIPNLQHLQTQ